ncbi:MAG: RHS repeat-associated core domain-containing protein [Chitinophagaceae bacterium]|nr:RHS repeat-associated core domain-containing protein [Chitinophagaceae bacterium]
MGYRFGFNGKELDKEVASTTTYDYGFRIYNPALGRFLSVDPLMNSYPWYTPYQFAGNMPIWAIDLDGLEEKKATILSVVRLFDVKGNLIKDPTNVEYGCTGCLILVAPSSTTLRQGEDGGDVVEIRTDYRQVAGVKFTISKNTVGVHKIPTPEPPTKNNTVQTNDNSEPPIFTGNDDRKPEVSWQHGILTTSTANMGTATSTTTLTKDLDIDFTTDRPQFKGNGAATISDYINSLPAGTTSINVKVSVNNPADGCKKRMV